MSGHMPPDFGEIGFARACFMDELAVEHHDQTIRQFEQFVEILADHRGEIKQGLPAIGTSTSPPGSPRQYRRLQVAARQH